MTITQNYKNAFTEVYTILDYIEDEDYAKIPSNVLEVIEENRNQNYEYEMNEDIDIFNQPMLSETKAILFNFYRDYWAAPEQREKIKRMQREERQKINNKKLEKYNPNNIFKKTNEKEQTKNALVEIRTDKWYIRIWNKIVKLFKK